jgi:ABC-type glycerol-3-phosphate transport system substrate-binding protein
MTCPRRLSALLGATALALALAACGGGGSSEGASGEGQITLEVWDQTYFLQDPTTPAKQYQQLDQEFMKEHPNIKIVHKGFPYNTYFTKLRTAIAAQEGPDVAFSYPGLFAADYKQGLVPLNSYLDQDPELKSQLLLLDESKAPDGNLYALPFTEYAYIYQYNKALFSQAGLDPESPPASWSDFLAACDKLHAAGITPIAAGWKDGFYYDWFQFIFTNQTVSKSDFDKMIKLQLPFDSEPFKSSERHFLELVQHNCFDPDAVGKETNEGQADFRGKKAAMLLWTAVSTDDEKAVGADNLGIFLPPELPDNNWGEYPVTDAGPNYGYGITRWSEHKDAAWQYIAFYLGPHGQSLVVSGYQGAPNNTAAKVTTSDPLKDEFVKLATLPANHTTYMSIPPSVQLVHEKYTVPFIQGQISVDDLVAKLEEERLRVAQKLGIAQE